jgi:uncharacterized integral membrane protein
MSEQTPDPTPDPTPEPEVTEPTAPPPAPPQRDDPLRRSRTSGAWTAVVVASVLLILLIVFIAQNTDDVQIAFFGWEGTTPLAVALLIATVSGVIITALIGTLRIWQLRRRVKRAH